MIRSHGGCEVGAMICGIESISQTDFGFGQVKLCSLVLNSYQKLESPDHVCGGVMTNDGEFLPMYSELRFVLRLLVLLSWLCFAS